MDYFNDHVHVEQKWCFAVRDEQGQRDALLRLRIAIDELRSAKRGAMASKLEAPANLLLGFQCIAAALSEEMQMWLALREGRPHDAWLHFVEAEDNVVLALRTPAATDGLIGWRERLSSIERAIYPRLTFLSIALSHTGGFCSICQRSFRDCDHVEGRIYCGQVCAQVRIGHVTAVDHVATVDHPQDKRCYMDRFRDESRVWRDIMTRLPLAVQPENDHPGDELCFGGNILHTMPMPGVEP